MDLLVLGAVVLVLTLVVYLLATLGTKETPFEDALAEQRQKFELENAQSKTEKQPKKPKVKKIKGKKDEGDPSGATSVQELEAEIEPSQSPPPVPEPSPSPQPSQEKKKEKKKKKDEEIGSKVNVEEVQKVVKSEVKKVESAAPAPPGPSAKDSRAGGKEVKAAAKETKAPAKETKASAKESSASIKEAKALGRDAPSTSKDTKNAAKDKATAKESNASAKDTKSSSKDTKVAAKEASPAKEIKATKETNTAKDINASSKDTKGKESKGSPKEGKATSKETNSVKETKAAVDIPSAHDQVNASDAVDVSPSADKGSSQDKKKKKDKPKNDITSLSESKLLPMVQRAPLSGTEIQTLIDVLLNKQQQNNAGGDWVKKGRVDPITQLRRQLEEVESRLRDKDEAHSALSAKITDLCSELHGERSRSSKLKTQLEDTIANYTRQQEVAAANDKKAQASRLNELRASLDQEYQIKFQQQQQLVEQLQNATNDNDVAALRSSLNEAEMQAKMIRQEHEVLTQRCQQYEEHIRVLEEKRVGEEGTRNVQLADLQLKLQNTDAARAQALAELAAMENDRESLSAQLASGNAKVAQLQHTLQEKMMEKAEVDSRLIQTESELCSVRQVILDQNTQIERLKEEKESLASQSVRPAAEGQENGDVHAEHTPAPNTALLESIVKEKEQMIEEQLSELTSLKKEITRLKEDLESQREKNNEATGVVEEEKAKVRAVLRRIFPDVVVDDALDQGAFLSEFETKALQVATQTAQSPEPKVVEKVVEVVKYVEKEVKVEDPALKLEVEKLSKENAELKSQVANLQEDSEAAAGDGERVKELQNEIASVNEKVAHYQTVLADTESLLKSLQASVESEEVAWKKRLSDKEKDLHQLVADKANLQLQVKQLEDTIDKVKQAEDIQEKLKSLQEQLQAEEKEKVSLLEKLQEAQEQLAKTATQGGVDSEGSVQELKADNEKLRTLVTVGQDASRQQEQLIEQLQKELTAAKTSSTNGPASEEQCQEGASATQ